MENQRYTRLDYSLMAALMIVTLAAAIVMAVTVTQRLPHLEDEIAYLFQAQTYARGHLWAPPAPASTGFFTPFVVSVADRRVGKYPPGWPLLLAVGERFGLAWLVNPILAALTIALTYMLGRELYNRQVGLTAAVLALASPIFLLQSATFMSHPASALWAALLAWAFLRMDIAREAGRDSRGWAALCGLCIGMLAITRPLTAVGVVLPFALVLVIRLLRHPRRIGPFIRAYWPLAALALVVTAVQPLYTYVLTGDPLTNLYLKVWTYDKLGFGPGTGRGPEGHTLAKAWRTAQLGVTLWSSDLFGWKYASWIPLVPGLVFGVLNGRSGRKYWPALLLAPFVLLVVVHMAYWVGAEVYGPRYYYEGHVGLAILAALGLCGTVRLVMAGIRRLARGASAFFTFERWGGLLAWNTWPVYPLVIALVALGILFYMPQRLGEWHGLYGIVRAPLDQFEELRQTDNVLLLIRGGHWPQYAAFFDLNNPWYDGPVVAVHDNNASQAGGLTKLFPGREIWYYNAITGQFSKTPSPYIGGD